MLSVPHLPAADKARGPRLTEVLPAQKSSLRNAIQFTPTHAGGLLEVITARSITSYAVNAFPTDFDGRAFHLAKLNAGTDAESEACDVFCGRRGGHRCDCKGFTYSRTGAPCKHILAAQALIENDWL